MSFKTNSETRGCSTPNRRNIAIIVWQNDRFVYLGHNDSVDDDSVDDDYSVNDDYSVYGVSLFY